MSKRSDKQGQDSFEQYYGELFGTRWSSLKEALLAPVRQDALEGKCAKPYFLDAGSKEAAMSLPLPDNGTILDMCAAPGGKALIIAERMPLNSHLVANELSADRRNRLIRVLDDYLETETRGRVEVTGRDASQWSRHEKSAYEAILLDVPCSSERHVLSSPQYLAQWSPARIKNLAYRQWALLSGAWLVLKPGGYLLYSTCALSPAENDEIIQRLFEKYADVSTERTQFMSEAEITRYGSHILPDTARSAGPIYYALLRKTMD